MESLISKGRASARFFYRAIAALFVVCLAACQSAELDIDLSVILTAQTIDPDRAAILIVNPDTGQKWSHGGLRIDERFVAASTSKIPHSFIALEAGYVAGPETFFEWDGQKRWAKSWNQDQTMATAYARSAVWVFQDIAQTLGPKEMAAGLKMFDYGNMDIGTTADITTYWLEGPLKISAKEQVAFLTKLRAESFPLKSATYKMGKEIMASGRDDGRFAKTGWYYSDEDTDIGWYVGWQEYEGSTYIFAFNLDMDDRDNDPPKRVKAVEAALAAIQTSNKR